MEKNEASSFINFPAYPRKYSRSTFNRTVCFGPGTNRKMMVKVISGDIFSFQFYNDLFTWIGCGNLLVAYTRVFERRELRLKMKRR